ncbi:hypothetical protein Ae707Ps1_1850 [Pseudonocardia sp. Ae707_Ps1]|nr:hypothetical protein Ae707Ps1_1850 [Pseudonocardia sp. Ae707_Ps1]
MNEWQERMDRLYAKTYRCRCGHRSTVRLVH